MPFEFLEFLRVPGSEPLLSAQRYVERLNLDAAEFAMYAGVDADTVVRHPEAPRIQQYLRDNVRVIRAAFDAADNDLDRALRWFRCEPIAAFDNKTAEALVAAGRGDDLIRFIESLKAGPAG